MATEEKTLKPHVVILEKKTLRPYVVILEGTPSRPPILVGTKFSGPTQRGPVGVPVFVLAYQHFVETFGESDTCGDIHEKVRSFFQRGGTCCCFVRSAPTADNNEPVND